jgi:hypothetical protein
MNKKFLLLTAALFALFSACSDNVVLQDPEPLPVLPDPQVIPPNPPNIAVETKANLTVRVYDAVEGKPLDATVTLLSTGEAKTADITGTVVFDSLHVGSYSLLIEKEGYASGTTTQTIYTVNNPAFQGGTSSSENILIAADALLNFSLPPLTSSLSGYLFYTDFAGKKHPAANAIVRIQLNGEYLKKIYQTVVGSDGKYSFADPDLLPAVGTNYQIWALEYTPVPGGPTYKTRSFTPTQLVSGVTAYVTGETTYEINDEVSLFTLISEKDPVVDSTKAIAFEFSSAVDVTKAVAGSISLTEEQSANVAWSTNGKTLTLTPKTKWTAGIFYVDLNLKSVSGKDYNVNHRVTVLGSVIKEIVPFILLNSYKTSVNDVDAVEFEFSDSIDVKKLANNTVTLSNAQVANIIWEGKKLIITPITKWTSAFNVTFNYALTSVRGETLGPNYIVPGNYSNSISITLNESNLSALKVKGLVYADTIDYNGLNRDYDGNAKSRYFLNIGTTTSYYFALKFTQVAGATGYKVYGKATAGANKGNFVQLADYYLDVSNDTVYVMYSAVNNSNFNNYPFEKGGEVEFVVQAYNGSSYTLISQTVADSSVVKVFDRRTPRLSSFTSPSGGSVVNFNFIYTYFGGYYLEGTYTPQSFENALTSALSTSSSNEITFFVNFTEPMDTNAVLTPSWPQALPPSAVERGFTVDRKWPTETQLQFTLKIATGPVVFDDVKATYRIAGLKDKRGNLFEITYTNGHTPPYAAPLNTLDFYFTANTP